MRSYILLVTSILLSSSIGLAQFAEEPSFKVTPGPTYKTFNRYPGNLFHNGDEIYSIKSKFKKAYFHRFDATTMEEIIGEKLRFPKMVITEGSFLTSAGLFVLFSTGLSKGGEELYCAEVDTKTGTWKTEPQLLVTTSDKILGSSGFIKKGVFPDDKFRVTASEDKSKYMIEYILKDEAQRDNMEYSVFGFAVFNASFKLLWQDEFSLPLSDENSGVFSTEIDNSGNVHLMTMGIDKDPRNPEMGELQARVYKKSSDKELSETNLDINPYRFIHRINMAEQPDGSIIYAGYCTNHKKNSTAEAVFFCRVNAQGELLESRTTPISLDVINQYTKEGTQVKNEEAIAAGEGGIPHLQLMEVKPMSDGGIIFFGEENRTIEDLKSGAQYFISEEAIITRMDKNGEVMWINKIPKRQTSDSKRELSYHHSYLDGNHYMFHTDNPKNLNLKLDDVPSRYSNRLIQKTAGVLMATVIEDRSGDTERKSVVDRDNVSHIFPSEIIEVDGEFFLEGYTGGRKDVLVKITL